MDDTLCREYAQVELTVVLDGSAQANATTQDYVLDTLVEWLTAAKVIPRYLIDRNDLILISDATATGYVPNIAQFSKSESPLLTGSNYRKCDIKVPPRRLYYYGVSFALICFNNTNKSK